MYDFVFFLKTYKNDLLRAKRLIETFKLHNTEKIPMYIAVPKDEIYLFWEFEDSDIKVIDEESICDRNQCFTKPIEGASFSLGYLNQEVYKLAFWETGIAKNYMCLDADGIFIRDFFKADFMYDNDVPYTVLVEDNDLNSDWHYALYGEERRKRLTEIQDVLDFHPRHMLTCHGFQILSANVLEVFKTSFIKNVGMGGYKDLIEISPFEFSWYNFFLQKERIIPIYNIEPLFRCFHNKQQHIYSVLQGMKLEDWSSGYIGIVMNSNFRVGCGEYDDLSVYNFTNSGLSESEVETNYNFWRNMKKRNKKSP